MQLKSFNRSVIAGTAAAAALLFFTASADARVPYTPVSVTIDGSAVNFAPPPIIRAGRVFVPLRGVFERLGASVVYANGTINATRGGRTISLRIGSAAASIDGHLQILDASPFIIRTTTYVPLRFISQALGAVVSWDNARRIAAIDMPNMAGAPSYVGEAPPPGPEPDVAPPPIPQYDQPPAPGPDYIWQPGYWDWASVGFYWVPGAWALPPQAGYLWTPGFWLASGGRYNWHPGYWGRSVGYYGGVNYGGGYNGNGYTGRSSGSGPSSGSGGSHGPPVPGRGEGGTDPGSGHENPVAPGRPGEGEPAAGPRNDGGPVATRPEAAPETGSLSARDGAAESPWNRFGDALGTGSTEHSLSAERGDTWSRFGDEDSRQSTSERSATSNAWSHNSWPSQGWSHSEYSGRTQPEYSGRTQPSRSYGERSYSRPSSGAFGRGGGSPSWHPSPGYARPSGGSWHGSSTPASHQSAPSHGGGGGGGSGSHHSR